MKQRLPEAFLEEMKQRLGSALPDFLASYDEERLYGLRVNTLKLEAEAFRGVSRLRLAPVPWAEEGFYYAEDERPGKHPYYHAGLYYIQEPSAMAPAGLLDVQPGERVLDLCAAPGGKTTQLAAAMAGEGVLVANDVHPDRVKALVKNIELMGIRHAVVLNEDPARLTEAFAGYFDKILVDAPCSGEGMFRKEDEMAKAWRPDWPARYAAMQRLLLEQAAAMLKPGGTLVYSTCTFSPEENEASIAAFLDAHPAFEPVPVELTGGRADWSPGRPDWLAPGAYARGAETVASARLWPHRLQGEGHYVALLRQRAGAGAPAGAGADAPGEEATRGEARAEAGPGGADGVSPPSRAGSPAAAQRRAQADAPKPKRRGGYSPGDREPGRSASRRGGAMAMRAATGAREEAAQRRQPRGEEAAGLSGGPLEALRRFAAEQLVAAPFAEGAVVCRGEHLYAAPHGLPPLDGIRVIRPGWYLGHVQNGRFVPSHALAMGLRAEEARRTVSLFVDDARVVRYLKGETLELPEEDLERRGDVASKGYALVCVDGFPLGWGRWHEGLFKNDYPAGWRWT